MNYISKKAISLVLSSISPKLHVVKSVEEILFGYEDPLLNLALKTSFIEEKDRELVKKVGWFYGVSIINFVIHKLVIRFISLHCSY